MSDWLRRYRPLLAQVAGIGLLIAPDLPAWGRWALVGALAVALGIGAIRKREQLHAWFDPASAATRWKVLRVLVGAPLYIAAFLIGLDQPAAMVAVAAGTAVTCTVIFQEDKARREENGDPPEIITGDWRRAFSNVNVRDVFRRGDRDA